jgi:hypothetical protein|tara:strand:+ start:906 stop:1415 length:510 start_codon:yes stop_codon:yes gene_type:complete
MKREAIHARIYFEDLKLQNDMPSRHAMMIFQVLIYFGKLQKLECGKYIERVSYPKQETIRSQIGISEYKLKKGISDLKKMKNPDGSPVLTVKKRTGLSSLYILRTPLEIVEVKGEHDLRTKRRTCPPDKKENMTSGLKGEHDIRTITNIEQTKKQTTNKVKDFSFYILD